MKVKELIEELKKYPEDAIVVRYDSEYEEEITEIGEWYKTDWINGWYWEKEFYERWIRENWNMPKILWPAVYLY